MDIRLLSESRREIECPETTRLLKRIVKKLVAVQHTNNIQLSGEALAADLTGISCQNLKRLSEIDGQQLKSFEFDIDRSLIHHTLMKFYLISRHLVSPRRLLDTLSDYIPPYVDIEMFRSKLREYGYYVKKVNNSHTILEDTNVTFERYTYLKKVIVDRKMSRKIYYVGAFAVNTKGVLSLQESLDTSSQLYVIFTASQDEIRYTKFIDGFTKENIEDWFNNSVLFELVSERVIVFPKEDFVFELVDEVPTLESLKVDMKEWLDRNNIPYEEDMTKVELFQLVERFKKTETIAKVEQLKSGCQHLLILPNCIKTVSVAWLVIKLIKENLKKHMKPYMQKRELQELITDLMNSISKNTLKEYDDYIEKEEHTLFNYDVQLDKGIESLITKNSFEGTTEFDSDLD